MVAPGCAPSPLIAGKVSLVAPPLATTPVCGATSSVMVGAGKALTIGAGGGVLPPSPPPPPPAVAAIPATPAPTNQGKIPPTKLSE